MTVAVTRWPLVLLGVTAGALAAFQQFKLPPVMPVLLADYGYDPVQAGAMMSVFAVAGLSLSVWAGRHAGRRGVGLLLAAAVLAFLAGNMVGLLGAASPWMMTAGRALEGIGTALAAVVGASLATDFAAPRHRPLAITLFAAWIPTGQLLSIGIGAPALALGVWQLAWVGAAAATLAIGLWAWRLRGALTKAGAGVGSPARAAPPDPIILAAGGVFIFWSAQYFAYMTWLPQFLVERHGFDPADAAWAYAIAPAMVLIGTGLAGRLMRAPRAYALGLAGSVVIQVITWSLIPITGAGVFGLLSIVLFGLSAGITPTCLMALPGRVVTRDGGSAAAFGVLMTGRNMGILAGPILLPQIIVWTGAWSAVPPVFAAASACALAGILFILFRLRRSGRIGGTGDQRVSR